MMVVQKSFSPQKPLFLAKYSASQPLTKPLFDFASALKPLYLSSSNTKIPIPAHQCSVLALPKLKNPIVLCVWKQPENFCSKKHW